MHYGIGIFVITRATCNSLKAYKLIHEVAVNHWPLQQIHQILYQLTPCPSNQQGYSHTDHQKKEVCFSPIHIHVSIMLTTGRRKQEIPSTMEPTSQETRIPSNFRNLAQKFHNENGKFILTMTRTKKPLNCLAGVCTCTILLALITSHLLHVLILYHTPRIFIQINTTTVVKIWLQMNF